MPLTKPLPAPTISDVAKAAGVSTATVSRAFSRPEMLREETVAQVHALATQLGYLPNPMARALSTGKQGNIAIVVPDIANPFFPLCFVPRKQLQTQQGSACFLETPMKTLRESCG